MKALVTGATGFIGSFLAEELIKKGYGVRCLVRKTSNLHWIENLAVDYAYGSLLDSASLRKALEGCQYIYHLAGITKARTEQDYFKGNAEGTRNLVESALVYEKEIKKFIYVGSQAAVGPSPDLNPIDESHPPRPLTYYGKSKLAGEEFVQTSSSRLAVTIIRPPVVYGQRDTDVLEFFRTVSKGIIPRLGGADKYISLIHVRDLVRGIIMAGESVKATGQTYFLCNPHPYSWQDISKMTLNVLNKKGINIPVPLGVIKVVAWASERLAAMSDKPALVNNQKVIEMQQTYWTCSPAKAGRELGFKTEIDLEQGIRETLNWYKENKWM
jgi:dihydroflavonol-4-reductase